MIWSSWICLGLPLAAAFAITLAGTRISRRTAGFLATASTLGSFAAAVIAYLGGQADAPWHGGPTWQAVGAVGAAGALLAEILAVIAIKAGGSFSTESQVTGALGSPAGIGRLFLTDHLLAFEITSIVLLVAAVGGVILGSHSRQT